MNSSAPIIHRALKREREKFIPGVVVSFTILMHPPAQFGSKPRTIGLIEFENGRRVLAPLIAESPQIGQKVHPRMRLSHVTEEGLRVYEVAYEALEGKSVSQKFPGYILALTGPSGVGKSTISKMLTKACFEYAENVPILTTRDRKPGDDGESIYTTREEFEHMKKEGSIVASTRFTRSSEKNRQYGYRNADIEEIWNKGKLPVVITEMHLLQDLARHYGRRSVLSFGLLPPGKSKRAKLSQLLRRLRTRGRETEEHIRDRLKNAERDLAFFAERKDLFDHMVVNENLSSIIASMKRKVSELRGT